MTLGAPSLASTSRAGAIVFAVAVLSLGLGASRAEAFNPIKKACGVAGLFGKLAGKACDLLQGGRLAKAGQQLLDGNFSGAGKALISGGATHAATALGLAAAGAWVLGGAKAALREAEKEIGKTTSPRLQTTWFSSTYWRVSGLGALLTLPFLFAAALQALIRSDLSLLARAAFGYLPLALLAVSIAAPLTMLVLAASDEMCAIVSSASGEAGVSFLRKLGGVAGTLSAIDGSPFLAFLVGVLITGAALAVSLELLVREAAVYVVVLMLPLAFAAMVWPARRIWAVRAVETLVALILAKFAIVAVLALAGGALGAGGASGMFAGTALVMLAAFSPLVLFRLLPFAELAAGASGALRGEGSRFAGHVGTAIALTEAADQWGSSLTGGMNDDADRSAAAAGGGATRPARQDPSGAPGDGLSGGPSGGPHGGSNGGASSGPAGADAALNGMSAASSTAAGDPRAERIPGMDRRWQAADGQWETLVLGSDRWRTSPLPPPGEDDHGDDVATTTTEPGAGSEGAAPLPPPQDPEGGPL